MIFTYKVEFENKTTGDVIERLYSSDSKEECDDVCNDVRGAITCPADLAALGYAVVNAYY